MYALRLDSLHFYKHMEIGSDKKNIPKVGFLRREIYRFSILQHANVKVQYKEKQIMGKV